MFLFSTACKILYDANFFHFSELIIFKLPFYQLLFSYKTHYYYCNSSTLKFAFSSSCEHSALSKLSYGCFLLMFRIQLKCCSIEKPIMTNDPTDYPVSYDLAILTSQHLFLPEIHAPR